MFCVLLLACYLQLTEHVTNSDLWQCMFTFLHITVLCIIVNYFLKRGCQICYDCVLVPWVFLWKHEFSCENYPPLKVFFQNVPIIFTKQYKNWSLGIKSVTSRVQSCHKQSVSLHSFSFIDTKSMLMEYNGCQKCTFKLNKNKMKWTLAKPRPIPNDIWQSLGLHLVNISVYADFITIFHSVQKIGPVSLFQNLELIKALMQISWARSCQYHCVCKSLSKYSKWFKSYEYFLLFVLGQNLKLSGDKIFTNCLVTKSNVWL